MVYRDLLPGRQGAASSPRTSRSPTVGRSPTTSTTTTSATSRSTASAGGCAVVYEDQGPPFVLEAGDCVLQPPGIRHRVLESSPGLEVVEVGSPAAHPTYVDHDLQLPTAEVRPERTFGGQRFVHHRAATATPQPWRADGFECIDTGIADATDGLAGVRNVRATSAARPRDLVARRRAAVLVRGRRAGHARPRRPGDEHLSAWHCRRRPARRVSPPRRRRAASSCSRSRSRDHCLGLGDLGDAACRGRRGGRSARRSSCARRGAAWSSRAPRPRGCRGRSWSSTRSSPWSPRSGRFRNAQTRAERVGERHDHAAVKQPGRRAQVLSPRQPAADLLGGRRGQLDPEQPGERHQGHQVIEFAHAPLLPNSSEREPRRRSVGWVSPGACDGPSGSS